jgi:hypothetical protein
VKRSCVASWQHVATTRLLLWQLLCVRSSSWTGEERRHVMSYVFCRAAAGLGAVAASCFAHVLLFDHYASSDPSIQAGPHSCIIHTAIPVPSCAWPQQGRCTGSCCAHAAVEDGQVMMAGIGLRHSCQKMACVSWPLQSCCIV